MSIHGSTRRPRCSVLIPELCDEQYGWPRHFSANPYNWAGEYGRASADIRNRFTFGGSLYMRWNILLSPLLIIQSGAPFNITTGSDLYGTTLFNARPGIATNPNTPGAIQTAYVCLIQIPRRVSRSFHATMAAVPARLR